MRELGEVRLEGCTAGRLSGKSCSQEVLELFAYTLGHINFLMTMKFISTLLLLLLLFLLLFYYYFYFIIIFIIILLLLIFKLFNFFPAISCIQQTFILSTANLPTNKLSKTIKNQTSNQPVEKSSYNQDECAYLFF